MRRILVVDDDHAIRDLLTALLGESGWRVDTAANGAEALVQVHQHRPDAVLLDLMMPVLDGWQFMQMCWGDPYCDPARVVVMSAAAGAAKAAQQLGAAAYIPKPFDVDHVLGTVDRLLTT